MKPSKPKTNPTLGFLTVVQVESLGRIGGLLVLNTRGRPVEFHCTSPLKTNRAQEILYGPTLDEYLHGEQIARTLVERADAKPAMLLTDDPSVLAVSAFTTMPVLLVATSDTETADADAAPQAATTDSTEHAGLAWFELGGQRVGLPATDRERIDSLMRFWSEFSEGFDLHEPFLRIHGALEEAQRGMAA